MNKKQKADVAPAQSGQQSNNANDWWKQIDQVTGRKPMTIDKYEKSVSADELAANARLIAAAPELLMCLRRFTEWQEYCEANADCGASERKLWCDAINAARAAIAKAERGQQ